MKKLLFVVLVLLLCAMPILAQEGESEPNDTFDQSNSLSMPGAISGSVVNLPVSDVDFFVVPTLPEVGYRAALQIDSPAVLPLKLVIYDQDKAYLTCSCSSDTSAGVSWTSYGDLHYIEVRSNDWATEVLTASYVLTVSQKLDHFVYLPAVVGGAAISTPTPSSSWWMCPDHTEGAAYAGSVKSSPLKFHKLSCHWASKISAANRICFASRQAAIDQGYRPCKVCNP